MRKALIAILLLSLVASEELDCYLDADYSPDSSLKSHAVKSPIRRITSLLRPQKVGNFKIFDYVFRCDKPSLARRFWCHTSQDFLIRLITDEGTKNYSEKVIDTSTSYYYFKDVILANVRVKVQHHACRVIIDARSDQAKLM